VKAEAFKNESSISSEFPSIIAIKSRLNTSFDKPSNMIWWKTANKL
jgi:hypothetical protein